MFEELLSSPQTVTLSSGETVEIPRLSWGKELKIYRILAQIFKEVPGVEEGSVDKAVEILTRFAEKVVELATLVLNKDANWVNEHLTSKDMIQIILPLCFSTYRRVNDGITSSLGHVTPPEEPRNLT